MAPDYAKYDAEQLHQARRTIDAARFPERVREIDQRLAALDAAPAADAAKPPAPPVDRSSDLPILQRAAQVLLAIGVLDLCILAYCIARGTSYNSSFNILALVAGAPPPSCAGSRGCGLLLHWSLSREH